MVNDLDGFPTKLADFPKDTVRWLCAKCGKPHPSVPIKPGETYDFHYLVGNKEERCQQCFQVVPLAKYDTSIVSDELPF